MKINERKNIFLYLERLKNYKKYVVCILIETIIIALFNIIAAYLYMKIIDGIAGIGLKQIMILIGTYFIISNFVNILEAHLEVFNKKFTNRMEYELQQEIVNRMLKQDGSFYTGNQSGEFMTYLITDAISVTGFISDTLIPVILDICKGIGIVIFLICLRWELLLLIVAIQPVILVLQGKMQKKMANASEFNRTVFGAYISKTKEYCANLIQIVMLSAENFIKKEYKSVLKKQKQASLKKKKIESMNEFVLGLVYILPICVLLVVGSYEIQKSLLTVGGLLLFLQYTGEVFTPFFNFYNMMFEYTDMKPSLIRIQNLLYIEETPIFKEKEKVIKKKGRAGCLVLKDICFSYEPGKDILLNASCNFKRGRSYAITGPSGCGKSTICKLLLGLWKANSGMIILDGEEINSTNSYLLRKNITYISQDNFILNDTIYNNVVLGNNQVTVEKFEKALKMSGIWDMVQNLELKENTMMGEEGTLFSGGQKHRIAIARAIVRETPIIILDEPTTALDPKLEREIMENLISIFCNKTLIIVTHNPEVSKKCDYIYQFNQGKLVLSKNNVGE